MANKRVTKKKNVKSLYWMCGDSCQHYDECPRPGDSRVCVYARQARKAAHMAKGKGNTKKKPKSGGTRR